MKGKINVYIREGKLKYDFELKRNITVIRGNSGSGKSTLVRIIEDYLSDIDNTGKSSTVIECGKHDIITLDSRLWKFAEGNPENYSNSIIFIDEQNSFMKSSAFKKFVEQSKAYFVLITRNSLRQLSYSIDEIYEIETKSGVHKFINLYPNKYKFYINDYIQHKPSYILTEDCGAGFKFFDSLNIDCETVDGNSNIVNVLKEEIPLDTMLVADGAAFGSLIDTVTPYIKRNKVQFYLPESFEYLLLDESVFGDSIFDVKNNTYNYAEGCSWEQFYTNYLKNKIKELGINYKKGELPKVFLDNRDEILKNNNLGFLIDFKQSNEL